MTRNKIFKKKHKADINKSNKELKYYKLTKQNIMQHIFIKMTSKHFRVER